MPARIVRPSTAFSRDPVGKHTKRVKEPKYLEFIRTLPCCVTLTKPVEAAHIRAASAIHGKPSTGKAQKPDDCWVVPLSAEQHRKQHSMEELSFWAEVGIDPFQLAIELYDAHAGSNYDAAVKAIHKARKR